MLSSSFIIIVRQASDNNEEELCATPQRELQMLSIELLKLLFQKNQKSKKAATRVEIEAFVSLFVARVGLFKRQKTFIFISLLAKDVHATRSKSAALILPRNTGEEEEEEEEEDKARDIPSSRENLQQCAEKKFCGYSFKRDIHIQLGITTVI